MGVVDLALPNQRMPLLVPIAEILLFDLGRFFDERNVQPYFVVRKAALDDGQEQFGALPRIALDLRFVSEFETD
jgi:hypothetical protein